MREMPTLGDRQRQVLVFIADHVSDYGGPPSAREICRKFGLQSVNTAVAHIDALERKGLLERSSKECPTCGVGAARGLKVTDDGYRVLAVPHLSPAQREERQVEAALREIEEEERKAAEE